jgi:hypothetical protein
MYNDQTTFLINQINRLNVDQKKDLLLEITKLEPEFESKKIIYEVGTGTVILLDKCKKETIEYMYNFINFNINK